MEINEKNMVTIQELLAIDPLINGKILGGWSGRTNKIEKIVDLNIESCPKYNNHFLYFLKITPANLEHITFILEKKVAGLILTGNSEPNLSLKVLNEAHRKRIPIIYFPLDFSLANIEFTCSLIKNLKKHDTFQLFARNSIYKKITKIDQFELLGYCEKLLKAPLLLVNKAFQLIDCSCHTKFKNKADLNIIKQIGQQEKNNWYRLKNRKPNCYSKSIVLKDGTNIEYILVPLIEQNYLYGFLISLENDIFTNIDKLLIEETGQVILQQLVHRKNLEEIEKKYKIDFIHDLLFNNFESKEQLIERAELWGFNLKVPQHLILIEPDIVNVSINYSEILEKIQLIIMQSITFSQQPLISEFNGQIVVIIPFTDNKDNKLNKKNILQLAHKLLKKLEITFPKLKLSMGVGRFYNSATDLCRSYQEAKNALALGKFIHEENHITHFEDLGIMRLLANLNYEQLEDFHQEYLGEIIEYDQKNETNMLSTLYMYFKQNGDINRTAEKLFIHPNSLRYRLKKIEELSEKNLQNYEDNLNLFIACKIARIRSQGSN